MAEPLSIIASVLPAILAAIQSTKSLYETVQHFKDRNKALRRLEDELEELTYDLNSLAEMTDPEISMLALLQDPIHRYSQICREFEQSIKAFRGKSKTGLHNWTKIQYMGGDINEFIDTIATYRTTISVALCSMALRHTSPVSHQVLQDYKEMIKDAAYNLEFRLQQVDEKIARLTSEDTSSDKGIDLNHEIQTTEECLRICGDARSYIEALTDQNDSSDDTSNPASVIFSVPSVLSTAATTNSSLTQDEMKRATDELVRILLGDEELYALYKAAVNDKHIGLDRFVRNFEKLLKKFSLNLKEESQEALHTELANLISLKAGPVASKIRQVLIPFSLHRPAMLHNRMKGEPAKALLDQPEDAGGLSKEHTDQEGEEHFAKVLAHGRNFFVESNAFGALREDLRNFVYPSAKQKVHTDPEILDEIGSEASPGPVPEASMSLWPKLSGMVVTLISRLGPKDDVIPPGHQRLRWKNARGKWLYDDYVEHDHGALKALKSYLGTLTYKTKTAAEGSDSDESLQPAQGYIPDRGSTGFHSSKTSDVAGKLYDAPENPTVDCHRQDLELGERSSRTLYLMVCLEKGRYSVVLHQEPVTEVIDDRQLFHTLQRVYYEHRGRFKQYWSLRTVGSIQFMKFTYGGHQYIDVRCHEEICETGKACSCIPPAKLVHPNGTEYECRPIPPKLSPPIGPRMMMDLFSNADHIEPNTTLIMDQLPKRASGQLKSDHSELKEAWGILYKEDWHWAKIWWILAVGFFPPSLLFGILWGTLKSDIQGAFGIAGWWMTGAMILIGIVGTRTWS